MAEARRKDLPPNVRMLIDLLKQPEKGELNYDGKEKEMSRLDALRELKRLEEASIISPPRTKCGVNLHIHTNESFSVFASPAEAAWRGYTAGLEVMGINDHYTIDGHREFSKACEILGLRAAFNMEAMAMSIEAKEKGARYNDPRNPGRTYLCGKGVVRDLKPGSRSEKLLKTVRAAFSKRCREMTDKVDDLIGKLDPSLHLSFEDVLRLTPRGNVTERHVAQAVTQLINHRSRDDEEQRHFTSRLIGRIEDEDTSREDTFQDLVRNRLLKVGGPAYVEEPPEAFPSIRQLVQLFRDLGAIPTYPVLGNPVTEKEKDLDSLFDELEGYGIYAVEVIPKRNTRERLEEILRAAEEHGFPVFNGTEHNTKAREPLLDHFSRDPTYFPVFRHGAHVVLGHQFLSQCAGKGYLDPRGRLTIEDRRTGTSLFAFAGRPVWPEEVPRWLREIGRDNAFRVILALHSFLGHKAFHELRVRRGFRIPDGILRKARVKEGRVSFADERAKNEFEERAKRDITLL